MYTHFIRIYLYYILKSVKLYNLKSAPFMEKRKFCSELVLDQLQKSF